MRIKNTHISHSGHSHSRIVDKKRVPSVVWKAIPSRRHAVYERELLESSSQNGANSVTIAPWNRNFRRLASLQRATFLDFNQQLAL